MEHGCVVFILRPRQVNWNRIEIYIRCVSTYYYKEMSGGVSLKHNILLVYVLQQLLTERREISKFIESNLICSIDKFYLSTCVFKSKKFYYIFIIIVIFNHFFFFIWLIKKEVDIIARPWTKPCIHTCAVPAYFLLLNHRSARSTLNLWIRPAHFQPVSVH